MTSIIEILTARWQHATNLLLGIWLVISPWALGYVDQAAAALNASVIGVLIALVAASALVAYQEPPASGARERGLGKFAPQIAEEWISAALATWLIVSPYLLNYAAMPAASWTHFAVGVLVLALTVWAAIAAQQSGGVPSKG